MSKEIPPFDPNTFDGTYWWRYGNEDTYVAMGTDSTVYRPHPDWVLKRYNNGVTWDQLCLYRQFMCELGEFVVGREIQLGMFGSFTLAVEPIFRLFQTQNTLPIMSISKYRGGKHFGAGKKKILDDFFKKFSIEVERELGYRGVEISTPNTKFQQLNMGIFYWAQYLCTITDGCDFITRLRKA